LQIGPPASHGRSIAQVASKFRKYVKRS
jgi:hypothetical protein